MTLLCLVVGTYIAHTTWRATDCYVVVCIAATYIVRLKREFICIETGTKSESETVTALKLEMISTRLLE